MIRYDEAYLKNIGILLEDIMENVPESEDSDEPMNWKAAPEHFLTYIWTERKKSGEELHERHGRVQQAACFRQNPGRH